MKPNRLLFLILCLCPLAVYAQTAEVGGAVQDPSGAVIPKASVEFRNQDTGIRRQTTSNGDGYYHITGVDPGKYDATVQAKGFKTLTRENITFQVGDKSQIDFKMQVGDTGQTVTVDGSGLTINTTDGSVSTVIDQKFVENIPLNRRSFQDLISMTPGVVTQSPQSNSQLNINGDFSVNGQRTESNYYIVDGVSGNIGSGNGYGGPSAGAGGSLPGATALGTTQGLLSVDALQEFRVKSSTYSAEFGHSPGGQFSFVTRSGTNSLHGTAFDYLRNNYFDANDWFNDRYGVAQPALRQNDFGGTIGGPVLLPWIYSGRERTFFLVSYEGLRLAQPQAADIQYVPDTYMRQQADPALQSILNAFPAQNGLDYGSAADPNLAEFIEAYSLPSTVNSTSVRIDQKIGSNSTAFFRFSDTPTPTDSRIISMLTTSGVNAQTYTVGLTNQFSSALSNEFRLGHARSHSFNNTNLDNYGGAISTNLNHAIGNSFSSYPQSEFDLNFPSIGYPYLFTQTGGNLGTQWNIVDTINRSWGKHFLKAGFEYRRITTTFDRFTSYVDAGYGSADELNVNSPDYIYVASGLDAQPRINQTSVFVQDQWRVSSRLTISPGVRWELYPPPTGADGHDAYTLLGSISDPSSLQLAPAGTPLWHTTWHNFAPRLGIAWGVDNNSGKETILRGGAGVFFDNGSQTSTLGFEGIGFGATCMPMGAVLPLTQTELNCPISVSAPYNTGVVYAYPSHMQQPYTLQWNFSVEQALGKLQNLTISYVGANGRRLQGEQEYGLSALNSNFGTVAFFPANLTSSYNALQISFQRSVSRGVQALTSYTWSHSIDFGSTYAALPYTRGNSDFDVRSNFAGGLSWEIPSMRGNVAEKAILNNWALDGRITARGSFPITLNGSLLTDSATGSRYNGGVNLIPGRSLYLYGSQYPGGRAINGGPNTTDATAAFITAGNGVGNAPRNIVRGFGEAQINLAARRDFPITESLKLQIRAEAFNILNHPNFGYVNPTLTTATFGQATKMLNESLGTVASQYQQGGPRSMQFMLKLAF